MKTDDTRCKDARRRTHQRKGKESIKVAFDLQGVHWGLGVVGELDQTFPFALSACMIFLAPWGL